MVRKLAGLVVVALLGALLGFAAEVVEPPTPAAAGDPEGTFIGMVPCRVVDTRAAVASQLGPDSTRSFQVGGTGSTFADQGGADGGCGVPDGARAVELSFTAIAPSGANGFLRAGPAGGTPTGTVLNYTVGTGITNTGTVPLAASGLLDLVVRNFGGTIHLAVDVQGYFVNTGGPRYVPVTPCRMVDTRFSTPAGPFVADETRTFRIGGSGVEDFASAGVAPQGGVAGGCGVPENATAIELTVTAASPEGSGFLRAGPNTSGDPTGTLLNFTSAQGITNTASVAFVGDGLLKVKVFGARTQVLIDVQGYYVSSGAQSEFVPVEPCRAVDTRGATPSTPLANGETRSFAVTGSSLTGQGGLSSCAVPTNAAAVEVSVTAAAPAGNGFLRVWPSGNTEPPATALNYANGRGITNTATVALSRGATNQVSVRNLGGATHVILDVQGYYTAPRSADRVVVGNGFGCALVSSGDVHCWGANSLGQLGRGAESFTPALQPRQTNGLFDGATRISAGRDHACVVTATGGIECWGSNFSGQLGLGTAAVNANAPTTLTSPALVAMSDVSAGYEHTCALRGDGTVWCWGRNSSGQLGNASTIDSNAPVQVSGLTNATSISAGYTHSCASRSDGTVRCWGANFTGQLGNGTATDSTVPVTVSGVSSARRVVTSSFATCAVDTSGGVRCWGSGIEGQLGQGTTGILSTTPVPVTMPAVADASGAFTGGPDGFCAVDDAGNLRCWGDGTSFVFADGDVAHRPAPTVVATGVASVDSGGDFDSASVCVARIDGGVRCWGLSSAFGDQNGTGNPFSGSAPTPVPGPSLPSGSTVSLSEWFPSGWGCALGGGAVRCWGANSSGQLGDGTRLPRIAPAVVGGLTAPTQVATGADHACAVVSGGGVRCWGRGGAGALGNGTVLDQLSPVSVTGLGGPATAVAAAADTTCALLSGGTVQCWGAGASGQLGNGTNTGLQGTPVTVSGLTGVAQLTAGVEHFCAVVTGGTARCWGSGGFGQLGQGLASSSSTPVTVAGLSGVNRVAAGFLHSCAQLTSGGVRCWGANSNGQLGDGSFTNRLAPVAASGLGGATSLAASGNQTCAVTGGTVRCWGQNQDTQIGDGTFADRGTPTTVRGLTGVGAVDVGYQSACARIADGSQRCWGARTGGGIGSAPVTATPRPVQQFGF